MRHLRRLQSWYRRHEAALIIVFAALMIALAANDLTKTRCRPLTDTTECTAADWE